MLAARCREADAHIVVRHEGKLVVLEPNNCLGCQDTVHDFSGEVRAPPDQGQMTSNMRALLTYPDAVVRFDIMSRRACAIRPS
jgi:hypothetical protein